MDKAERASVQSVSLLYFLYFIGITLVVSIVNSLIGIKESYASFFPLFLSLIFIAVVVKAHIYFKNNNDGIMTFGQGFSIGAFITLLSSSITALIIYGFLKYIDNSALQTIFDQSIEKWEAQGISQEQIDAFTGFFSSEFISFLIFMMYSVGGLITSLILPIFTKKENQESPF